MGTDKRERQKAQRQARLEAARVAQQRADRQRRIVTFVIIGVAVAALIGVAVLVGNRKQDDVATTDTTAPSTVTTDMSGTLVPAAFTYGTGACPPTEGVTEPMLTFTEAPQQCIDPTKQYLATFQTSEGTVKVLMDTERTPGTANNFVTLARYGYYDGTQIFRADPSIEIIQGGAPHTNSATDPGPGYTIPDEGSGFTYHPGQLVMARTSQPNSAGAQFFFVAGPAASALDQAGTYVVFGDVTEGLDVVQAILALSDGSGELGGTPSRPVTIESVTIEELPAGSVVTTWTVAAAPGEATVSLPGG